MLKVDTLSSISEMYKWILALGNATTIGDNTPRTTTHKAMLLTPIA
jgi:hypothetical protein